MKELLVLLLWHLVEFSSENRIADPKIIGEFVSKYHTAEVKNNKLMIFI